MVLILRTGRFLGRKWVLMDRIKSSVSNMFIVKYQWDIQMQVSGKQLNMNVELIGKLNISIWNFHHEILKFIGIDELVYGKSTD